MHEGRMVPLSLFTSHMSISLTFTNTYTPYGSKCRPLLSPFFMLPPSHWLSSTPKTPPSSPSFQPNLISTPFPVLHSFRHSPLGRSEMIRTLNPYNSTAKTAEIMSRYRPIAPKPEPPVNPMFERASMSQKMRESPYLRNLWPQLQARPTRSRKRGRPGISSAAALKRPRTHLMGFSFSPPSHVTSPMHGFPHAALHLPAPNMAPPSFAPLHGGGFDRAISTTAEGLMTLPLLPCPPPPNDFNCLNPCAGSVVFDMNVSSVIAARIPEERDLLQQLQGAPATATTPIVISPRPVRPIGSSISVRCIRDDQRPIPEVQILKKPEEVEEEIESETLPAVISDSNNKIRMANSAYKEMVGQPECPWLNSMVNCGNRISGEVMLELSESKVPVSSNGFSCWASIEWGSPGNKNSLNAFCEATRSACESKDYLFTWRFHTNSSNV